MKLILAALAGFFLCAYMLGARDFWSDADAVMIAAGRGILKVVEMYESR